MDADDALTDGELREVFHEEREAVAYQEAKAQPPVTAPTPERRVGEAKRPRIEADRVEELADGEGIWIDALPDGIAPGIGNEPWDSREAHDLALDLLDERAAVARLTAEVERLREFAERMISPCEWGPSAFIEDHEANISDWAVSCGILVERVHAQPCEIEGCECDGSPTLLYFAWSPEAAALSLPTPAQEACQLSHEPNAETARAIEEAIYFPPAAPKGGA